MRRKCIHLLAGVCLAMPATASADAPKPVSPCEIGADLVPAPGNLELVRSATLCLVNRVRARNGLPALRVSLALRKSARRHSRDMLAHAYFDHARPDGPSLKTRLRKVRYRPRMAAENLGIASGDKVTPAAMVDAWMDSEVHRVNILARDFSEAGLGIVLGTPLFGDGVTYTMDFGHR